MRHGNWINGGTIADWWLDVDIGVSIVIILVIFMP